MSKQCWIEKLNLEVTDQDDGGCMITIDWDADNPELAEWTSWGEEKQKTFVIDSLYNALECFIDHDH